MYEEKFYIITINWYYYSLIILLRFVLRNNIYVIVDIIYFEMNGLLCCKEKIYFNYKWSFLYIFRLLARSPFTLLAYMPIHYILFSYLFTATYFKYSPFWFSFYHTYNLFQNITCKNKDVTNFMGTDDHIIILLSFLWSVVPTLEVALIYAFHQLVMFIFFINIMNMYNFKLLKGCQCSRKVVEFLEFTQFAQTSIILYMIYWIFLSICHR